MQGGVQALGQADGERWGLRVGGPDWAGTEGPMAMHAPAPVPAGAAAAAPPRPTRAQVQRVGKMRRGFRVGVWWWQAWSGEWGGGGGWQAGA